ncbi:MAG TPA: hypothetical protein PKG81_00595 [Candidatus Omnitrophota bacterium]|nr:hypothetical protein [Candidatus Omnitrophota bacterium]
MVYRSVNYNVTKNRLPYRMASLVTLAAFVVTTMFGEYFADRGWAETPNVDSGMSNMAVSAASPANKIFDLKTFEFPKNLATVNGVYQSTLSNESAPQSGIENERKIIIHIQDAHCNYACQKKVSEIISYLSKEYGIDTVNLEGGEGAYNTEVFTDISDRSVRERTSDFFLREGVLNGAEYFAVNNPDKISLWGVENTGLYLENLDIYRASRKYVEEAKKYIASLNSVLGDLKCNIYSDDLLAMDIKYAQYKSGNLEFKNYLSSLIKKASEVNIDIRSFTNIYLLNLTLAQEEDLDFDRANKDRERLIDDLQGKFSQNETETLVAKTVEFRNGTLAAGEYYAYIMRKAKFVNLDIDAYPDFKKYTAYLSVYNSVDKYKIMDEMDELEKAIKNRLYQNEEQKTLDMLSKNLVLMKNMFDLTLTKQDYSYYLRNEPDFGIEKYLAFIRKISTVYKTSTVIGPSVVKLDIYRKDMACFFECSFRRDSVFMRNLKFSPKSANGTRAAILVTGGFHTENLQDVFRDRDISYISVMPVFTEDKNVECQYFSLLGSDASPLIGYMTAKLSTLAIYTYLADQSGKVHGGLNKEDFGSIVQCMADLLSGNDQSVTLKDGRIFKLMIAAEAPLVVRGKVEQIPGAEIDGKQIWAVWMESVASREAVFPSEKTLNDPRLDEAVSIFERAFHPLGIQLQKTRWEIAAAMREGSWEELETQIKRVLAGNDIKDLYTFMERFGEIPENILSQDQMMNLREELMLLYYGIHPKAAKGPDGNRPLQSGVLAAGLAAISASLVGMDIPIAFGAGIITVWGFISLYRSVAPRNFVFKNIIRNLTIALMVGMSLFTSVSPAFAQMSAATSESPSLIFEKVKEENLMEVMAKAENIAQALSKATGYEAKCFMPDEWVYRSINDESVGGSFERYKKIWARVYPSGDPMIELMAAYQLATRAAETDLRGPGKSKAGAKGNFQTMDKTLELLANFEEKCLKLEERQNDGEKDQAGRPIVLSKRDREKLEQLQKLAGKGNSIRSLIKNKDGAQSAFYNALFASMIIASNLYDIEYNSRIKGYSTDFGCGPDINKIIFSAIFYNGGWKGEMEAFKNGQEEVTDKDGRTIKVCNLKKVLDSCQEETKNYVLNRVLGRMIALYVEGYLPETIFSQLMMLNYGNVNMIRIGEQVPSELERKKESITGSRADIMQSSPSIGQSSVKGPEAEMSSQAEQLKPEILAPVSAGSFWETVFGRVLFWAGGFISVISAAGFIVVVSAKIKRTKFYNRFTGIVWLIMRYSPDIFYEMRSKTLGFFSVVMQVLYLGAKSVASSLTKDPVEKAMKNLEDEINAIMNNDPIFEEYLPAWLNMGKGEVGLNRLREKIRGIFKDLDNRALIALLGEINGISTEQLKPSAKLQLMMAIKNAYNVFETQMGSVKGNKNRGAIIRSWQEKFGEFGKTKTYRFLAGPILEELVFRAPVIALGLAASYVSPVLTISLVPLLSIVFGYKFVVLHNKGERAPPVIVTALSAISIMLPFLDVSPVFFAMPFLIHPVVNICLDIFRSFFDLSLRYQARYQIIMSTLPEYLKEWTISKKNEIRAIIDSPAYDPEDLIKVLKDNPYHGQAGQGGISWMGLDPRAWGMSLGLREGYNLETHTLMVMRQFEKYFNERALPNGINRDFFRLLTALHDIGKPKAIQEGRPDLQFVYTRDLINELRPMLPLTDKEVLLASAILNGDPIGKYLKSEYSLEEAVGKIRKMAKSAGMNDGQFFDILTVFYQSDASSYTEDAGGRLSLEFLFEPGVDGGFYFDETTQRIKFMSGGTRTVFNALEDAVKSEKPVFVLSLKDRVLRMRAWLDSFGKKQERYQIDNEVLGLDMFRQPGANAYLVERCKDFNGVLERVENIFNEISLTKEEKKMLDMLLGKDRPGLLRVREKILKALGGDIKDESHINDVITEQCQELTSLFYKVCHYKSANLRSYMMILNNLRFELYPDEVSVCRGVSLRYAGYPGTRRAVHAASDWAYGEIGIQVARRYNFEGADINDGVVIRTTMGDLRKSGVIMENYDSVAMATILFFHNNRMERVGYEVISSLWLWFRDLRDVVGHFYVRLTGQKLYPQGLVGRGNIVRRLQLETQKIREMKWEWYGDWSVISSVMNWWDTLNWLMSDASAKRMSPQTVQPSLVERFKDAVRGVKNIPDTSQGVRRSEDFKGLRAFDKNQNGETNLLLYLRSLAVKGKTRTLNDDEAFARLYVSKHLANGFTRSESETGYPVPIVGEVYAKGKGALSPEEVGEMFGLETVKDPWGNDMFLRVKFTRDGHRMFYVEGEFTLIADEYGVIKDVYFGKLSRSEIKDVKEGDILFNAERIEFKGAGSAQLGGPDFNRYLSGDDIVPIPFSEYKMNPDATRGSPGIPLGLTLRDDSSTIGMANYFSENTGMMSMQGEPQGNGAALNNIIAAVVRLDSGEGGIEKSSGVSMRFGIGGTGRMMDLDLHDYDMAKETMLQQLPKDYVVTLNEAFKNEAKNTKAFFMGDIVDAKSGYTAGKDLDIMLRKADVGENKKISTLAYQSYMTDDGTSVKAMLGMMIPIVSDVIGEEAAENIVGNEKNIMQVWYLSKRIKCLSRLYGFYNDDKDLFGEGSDFFDENFLSIVFGQDRDAVEDLKEELKIVAVFKKTMRGVPEIIPLVMASIYIYNSWLRSTDKERTAGPPQEGAKPAPEMSFEERKTVFLENVLMENILDHSKSEGSYREAQLFLDPDVGSDTVKDIKKGVFSALDVMSDEDILRLINGSFAGEDNEISVKVGDSVSEVEVRVQSKYTLSAVRLKTTPGLKRDNIYNTMLAGSGPYRPEDHLTFSEFILRPTVGDADISQIFATFALLISPLSREAQGLSAYDDMNEILGKTVFFYLLLKSVEVLSRHPERILNDKNGQKVAEEMKGYLSVMPHDKNPEQNAFENNVIANRFIMMARFFMKAGDANSSKAFKELLVSMLTDRTELKDQAVVLRQNLTDLLQQERSGDEIIDFMKEILNEVENKMGPVVVMKTEEKEVPLLEAGIDGNSVICPAGKEITPEEIKGAFIVNKMKESMIKTARAMYRNIMGGEDIYDVVIGNYPTGADGNPIENGLESSMTQEESAARRWNLNKQHGNITLMSAMGGRECDEVLAKLRGIIDDLAKRGVSDTRTRINCSVSASVFDKLVSVEQQMLKERTMLSVLEDRARDKDDKLTGVIYPLPYGRLHNAGISRLNLVHFLKNTAPEELVSGNEDYRNVVSSYAEAIALVTNNDDTDQITNDLIKMAGQKPFEFFVGTMFHLMLPPVARIDLELVREAFKSETEVLRAL